ncbi:4Fe-4S single cluster domain-containing protein [Paenibacillus motobuensis]|uniref:4Fe-4S single cluster domain-containing protein n=1 Tax=Paenibacillus motobuensis TaxID=295324 RepID=A0ABN0Y0G3_9BACL
MSTIRISRIVKETKVEGPGLRYALWVQGCPIRCEGCFNPHTWDMNGGEIRNIDDIVCEIEAVLGTSPELEGITLLGGEPFSQAYELSVLARKVKGMGLSVVTFSGYDYETIRQSGHNGWRRLLQETDLLIDGPFIQSLHDLSRPWIGSRNQQYRFLTNRYKELEASLTSIDNKLEIRLHPDGTITANGMARISDLELLRELGYQSKEVKE